LLKRQVRACHRREADAEHAAEGLSHRGDEADFAGRTISEAVLTRGLLRSWGSAGAASGRGCAGDFGGGHNEGASPMAVGVERMNSIKRMMTPVSRA